MKFRDILETIDVPDKAIESWILSNCYGHLERVLDESDLEFFSINSDRSINAKGLLSIISTASVLPYKLHECYEFRLDTPELLSCENFPIVYIPNLASIHLNYCTKLDFSKFPIQEKPVELQVRRMTNITISKLFAANQRIAELSIDESGNRALNDCSQWDAINVRKMLFQITYEPLRNLQHILNIPQSKMKILHFTMNGYYHRITYMFLNDLIRRYREDRHNAAEYVMDFTVELIDKGLEDIV